MGVMGWRTALGKWVKFNPYMNEYMLMNEIQGLSRFYLPPRIVYESSDGRLWFILDRTEEWKTLRSGIAWYDPNTNEGCWFTTDGFNIVEDDNDQLWILTGKDLYSYSRK
jgi:hypothetical protein